VEIDIAPVQDPEALGLAWRELEARSPGRSVFQSWTWVGCLAGERYPDPVLVRARGPEGRTLGLALFNRRRGRLCLAESGDPAMDAPFVEHNAPLVAADAPPSLAGEMLRAAWGAPGARRLVLSGVPPGLAAAAGGAPLRRQARRAPFVDLAAVRAAGGDWMATLSANTRYQIRRSLRRYAARGPVAVGRAETEGEALAWLDALVALHTETWHRRGQPGGFATPWLMRFHRALVARALARSELELLRVAAGGEAVGYLYNFRLEGRVSAYQSGLDHAGAGPHGKPGLTCHALAIERALAAGDLAYDFLAGADRYKLSLANAEADLDWVEAVPAWSPLGVAARLRWALRARFGR
jgi:CelD/BcsL family acetyltransferase involved in cellulose biosynthesis